MLLSKKNWGDGIARPKKRYTTGCDGYSAKLDNAKVDMARLVNAASVAVGWFIDNEFEDRRGRNPAEKQRIEGVLNTFFALHRIPEADKRRERLEALKGM